MNRAEAVVLMPRAESEARVARRILTTSLAANGLAIDEWRRGDATEAAIVSRPAHVDADEFARRLASARVETQERASAYRLEGFELVVSYRNAPDS